MTAATFYRRVWRWHFWAGFLCAPVLVVTALTGAVYVFKDEIEANRRPHLAYVVPYGERKPFDDLLAAVREKYPGGMPTWSTVYAESDRSTVIQVAAKGGSRLVFVNPYSAEVLGDEPAPKPDDFFPVVLKLHRNLYAGVPGELMVELVTSWTIVLVVTGFYLWWPKRLTAVAGVWLPRVRAPVYTVLRDLRAVPGIWLAVVALLLAGTGLFFTQAWRGIYSDFFGTWPEHLTSPPAVAPRIGPSVPIETAVREARARWPDARLMINPASAVPGATVNRSDGDRLAGYVAVDRLTGEVVADRRAADVPFPHQIKLWVYSVHVGSVYGTPTKVLAVLGCLVLAFGAVSGVAMWLVRRPRGTTGFPAASDAKVPVPAVVAILVLAVLLPTVGASLLLVLAGESVWNRAG